MRVTINVPDDCILFTIPKEGKFKGKRLYLAAKRFNPMRGVIRLYLSPYEARAFVLDDVRKEIVFGCCRKIFDKYHLVLK